MYALISTTDRVTVFSSVAHSLKEGEEFVAGGGTGGSVEECSASLALLLISWENLR